MLRKLLYFLLILTASSSLLVSCKGDKNKVYSHVRENEEDDIAQAIAFGKVVYGSLVQNNHDTIRKWFDKSLYKDIPSFRTMLQERKVDWGQLLNVDVYDATTRIVKTNVKDTLQYTLYVRATYEQMVTEDEINIQKIGGNAWKIIEYDFAQCWMYTCGELELEGLQDDYLAFTQAYVKNDRHTIDSVCGTEDAAFIQAVYELQNYYFENASLDTLEYFSGYVRSECGAKAYANGFLTYLAQYNDTSYAYITCFVTRNYGERDFYLYKINVSPTFYLDEKADVDFVKDISRDVLSLIRKNDARGFYEAFHPELKATYGDENRNLVDSLLLDFKEMGEFDDFYAYSTFRNGDINNESVFAYYVVVLQLRDKDEVLRYLELVFKPDEEKKFRLLNCRELYW